MMIDAHVHLWRLARGDNVSLSPSMVAIWKDREPADLAPRLADTGVDRVVAVQAAETLDETLYLVGLAREHPVIAGVVAWIELASPAVREEAAALASLAIVKGVRPIRDDNRSIAYLLDARLDAGWDALAEHDLTLDVLVQNWREIALVSVLVRRMPTLRVILDHCGKPDIAGRVFVPWAEAIEELASVPNVACKLSGLMNCARPDDGPDALAPYADHVLDSFGAERVMWASDWPPLDLASDYATWRRVSLVLLAERDEEARRRILGATAAAIYRLPSDTASRGGARSRQEV